MDLSFCWQMKAASQAMRRRDHNNRVPYLLKFAFETLVFERVLLDEHTLHQSNTCYIQVVFNITSSRTKSSLISLAQERIPLMLELSRVQAIPDEFPCGLDRSSKVFMVFRSKPVPMYACHNHFMWKVWPASQLLEWEEEKENRRGLLVTWFDSLRSRITHQKCLTSSQ